MLKIIVLICSVSLDRFACQPETATDTVITNQRVASAQQCAFLGQSMLAPTALVPDPTKFYTKIMCVQDRDAATR